MTIARTATLFALARSTEASFKLLIPIVLVRSFSMSEFGLYKQIDLVAALLLPLLLIGLDKSVTYFVPRLKSDPVLEISTPVFALLTIAAGLFLFGFLFPGMFGRVFGSSSMRLLVAAISMMSISRALTQIAQRALLAVECAGLAAAMPLVVGIPRAAAILTVGLLSPSLDLVLTVCIAFPAIDIVFVLAVLAHKGYLRPSANLQILGRQLRYGGTLGGVSLAQSWAVRIDRYLVSTLLDPAVFAVYSVGKTRIPFLRILPSALDAATAPRFSRLDSENRHRQMAALWRKRCETLLPLNLMLAFFLCLTAGWTIPLVFTAAYSEAVPVFRIYIFSLVVQAMGGLDLILRALAALRFLVLTVIVSLVARFLFCLAVLPLNSLAVLAATQIVISVVILSVRLIYVRRRLQVTWSEILPRKGLGLTGSLSALAAALTILVGRWLGGQPLLALAVSAAVWAALICVALWKQGLWRQVLSRPSKTAKR